MPQPTTLVIAAGLAIVGAAIGVNMGHATVDQINPANFKDSDSAFADPAQDSRSPDEWAQAQSQEYKAAAQAAAPQGCAGCTWPVAPVPPQDPIVARYDQPRTAAVPRERVEAPVRVVVIDEQRPPELDWGRVERYARYPVERTRDQAAEEDDDDGGDAGTQ
ncbi:MAG TPA: hypothetical protein VH331_05770 [Allosphingosinicella sp.]|nr:hypothetical protein [Allosphingosinicella sp.]